MFLNRYKYFLISVDACSFIPFASQTVNNVKDALVDSFPRRKVHVSKKTRKRLLCKADHHLKRYHRHIYKNIMKRKRKTFEKKMGLTSKSVVKKELLHRGWNDVMAVKLWIESCSQERENRWDIFSTTPLVVTEKQQLTHHVDFKLDVHW